MLRYAYHMEAWRISGTQGSNTLYTLEATTAPNTTQDQVRLMMMNLLVERFHIETHRTTKVIDGYALTASKHGAKVSQTKFKPENESGEFDEGFVIGILPDAETMQVRGHRASMLQLTEYMQRDLDTFVADRTNLTGRYDFELTCGRDNAHSAGGWGSCLNGAGLAIGKYKAPVEFLVIDRVEPLVEN